MAILYTVLDYLHEDHDEHGDEHMLKETAIKWVGSMANSDNSHGQHWTMDQTSQVLKQRGWALDPTEFYAVINSLWSDYGAVAKKFGVDNVDYWTDMTHAWLDDKDAMEDKASRYYKHIVQH